MRKTSVPLVLLLATVTPLWAQTAPVSPPNAGTLLEQQRRQRPPAQPQAVEPGVLPANPTPLPEPVGADGLTTVQRFQLEGGSLVESAAIQSVLSPWLQRPVSLADLRRATAAVEALYRQRGWLARVSLPGQDITDGTVRLLITESRLGRIVLQQSEPPLESP